MTRRTPEPVRLLDNRLPTRSVSPLEEFTALAYQYSHRYSRKAVAADNSMILDESKVDHGDYEEPKQLPIQRSALNSARLDDCLTHLGLQPRRKPREPSPQPQSNPVFLRYEEQIKNWNSFIQSQPTTPKKSSKDNIFKRVEQISPEESKAYFSPRLELPNYEKKFSNEKVKILLNISLKHKDNKMRSKSVIPSKSPDTNEHGVALKDLKPDDSQSKRQSIKPKEPRLHSHRPVTANTHFRERSQSFNFYYSPKNGKSFENKDKSALDSLLETQDDPQQHENAAMGTLLSQLKGNSSYVCNESSAKLAADTSVVEICKHEKKIRPLSVAQPKRKYHVKNLGVDITTDWRMKVNNYEKPLHPVN